MAFARTSCFLFCSVYFLPTRSIFRRDAPQASLDNIGDAMGFGGSVLAGVRSNGAPGRAPGGAPDSSRSSSPKKPGAVDDEGYFGGIDSFFTGATATTTPGPVQRGQTAVQGRARNTDPGNVAAAVEKGVKKLLPSAHPPSCWDGDALGHTDYPLTDDMW